MRATLPASTEPSRCGSLGRVTTYRERLTAPLSWWIAVVAFGLVWGWIMLVGDQPARSPSARPCSATVVAGALVWSYGSVVVESGPDGPPGRIGPPPPSDIGSVEALDARGFREQLGPQADARAWLRTRPYIEAGVRVDVVDPSDPTPYWLVSSRRPEAVVAALGQTGPAGVPIDERRGRRWQKKKSEPVKTPKGVPGGKRAWKLMDRGATDRRGPARAQGVVPHVADRHPAQAAGGHEAPRQRLPRGRGVGRGGRRDRRADQGAGAPRCGDLLGEVDGSAAARA